MSRPFHVLLVTVTGRDRPGITATLTEILERHGARIRDVEQTVNAGNLSLSLQIGLPTGERDQPIFKDLLFAAWELGIHVDFQPLEEAGESVRRPTFALTLLGDPIEARAIARTTAILARHDVNIDRITRLSGGEELSCLEMILSSTRLSTTREIKELLMPIAAETGIDLALQREGYVRRVKRLVVLDVDSTLVQGEVIDELARRRGCLDRVAAITERAMQGELAFPEALRERVGLLAGTPMSVLEDVQRGVQLTPGATELLRVLRRLGYRLAIISGGFTFFTDRLKADLQLDHAFANELEIAEGRLTGRIVGPIIDGQRKADLLVQLAREHGIGPDQAVAIGDGANDLLMLARAGLGIAFNAKRVVRERADHAINRPRLDSILYLLGISEAEKAELLAP